MKRIEWVDDGVLHSVILNNVTNIAGEEDQNVTTVYFGGGATALFVPCNYRDLVNFMDSEETYCDAGYAKVFKINS